MMGKTFDSVWEGQQAVSFFIFANQVTSWGAFDSIPPPFSLLSLLFYGLRWCWEHLRNHCAGPAGFRRLGGGAEDVVPERFELMTFPNGQRMPGSTAWSDEYPTERLPGFVQDFIIAHMQDGDAGGDDDEVRWRAHLMKQQWRIEQATKRLEELLLLQQQRPSLRGTGRGSHVPGSQLPGSQLPGSALRRSLEEQPLGIEDRPAPPPASEAALAGSTPERGGAQPYDPLDADGASGAAGVRELLPGLSHSPDEVRASRLPPSTHHAPPEPQRLGMPAGPAEARARQAASPRITRGFLIKQPVKPHLLSNPRRRLFVLRPGLLQWFEDDSPSAALRGEMELTPDTVIETRPDPTMPSGRALVLRSTMRTTVQELVLTPSPDDTRGLGPWESAIRRQAAS